MKLPRFRIRTLMVVVAASAFLTWGSIRFPGPDHLWTSIILGILIGVASWVIPLVVVCVILRFNPGWRSRPVAPESPDPE